MKLVNYDKNRMKIKERMAEIIFNSNITSRETVERVMKMLDSLPADYAEEQVRGIDQAYQRVCRELEEARREVKEQRAVDYAAFHMMIAERIGEIQMLLFQYPEAAARMSGRLDELNMMLEKCKKKAAGERRNDLSIK